MVKQLARCWQIVQWCQFIGKIVEVIQLVRVTLDAVQQLVLTSCSDVQKRGGADAGSRILRCQAT